MPLKLWSRSPTISTITVIFRANAGLLSSYVGGPCACRNAIGEHCVSIDYCDFTVSRSSTPLDLDSARCTYTRVPPAMSTRNAARQRRIACQPARDLGVPQTRVFCQHPSTDPRWARINVQWREECTITTPAVRGVNRSAARDVCAPAISILQIGCLARSYAKKGENQVRQGHVSKRSQRCVSCARIRDGAHTHAGVSKLRE